MNTRSKNKQKSEMDEKRLARETARERIMKKKKQKALGMKFAHLSSTATISVIICVCSPVQFLDLHIVNVVTFPPF